MLSACVWLIVSVNIIIPTVFCGNYMSCGQSYVYIFASRIIQSKLPVFKDYVLQPLGRIITGIPKVKSKEIL
jgi:hypothetical protein